MLSFPAVQTALARKITKIVNKDFGTDINIGKIDISSLRNVVLEDVLINDHHQDSLIYVEKLSTSFLNYLRLSKSDFDLGDAELKNGFLHMRTYKGEDTNNLTYFVNLFETDTTPSENVFKLHTKRIRFENIAFFLYDENKSEEPVVFYKNITGDLDDFSINGPEVKAKLRQVSMQENFGIDVKSLDTDFLYSPTRMEYFKTRLITPDSDVKADIEMDYDEDGLSDFNNKVLITASFKDSEIALTDLKKFYKKFGTKDRFKFSAEMKGVINDFVVDKIDLKSARKNRVKGQVHLKNAVSNKPVLLEADFKQFTSSAANLKLLLPGIFNEKLAETIGKFGKFTSRGKVKLNSDHLLLNLKTKSDLGDMITDIDLENYNDPDLAGYKGRVELKDFNIGKIAGDSLIGNITMLGEVDGHGFNINSLNTTVKGTISDYVYKHYNYTNISINGIVRNKHFNGDLKVDDPNIKLTFNGLADLSGDRNRFRFNADVDHADFNKLNLYAKDSLAVLKGKIEMDLSGNDFDNLIGTIAFHDASYINENDNYFFKDFTVTASEKDSIRTLKIDSPDIVNGNIRGRYKYRELLNVAMNSIGSTFSNYKKKAVTPGQFIDYNFTINNKIVEVFFPQVVIGPNTFIKGAIDSDKEKIELLLKSPKIELYNTEIDEIKLNIDNKMPLYNGILSIKHVKSDLYELSDINLVNVFLKDTIFIRANMLGGAEQKERYDISLYHTIDAEKRSVFGFKHSEIEFKGNKWLINGLNNNQNKVVFDEGYKTFAIDNIDMVSGNQRLDLAGAIHGGDKSVDLKFKDVNLNAITPDIDSLKFGGKVNGEISLVNVKGKALPFSDLTINYFSINDNFYGDFSFNAEANNSLGNYVFDARLVNGDLTTFEAKGGINFELKNPVITANVSFDKFDLTAFSPLGKDILSNIRGFASGKATVTGLLENPNIDGEIVLNNGGIKIPYLNVDYDFGKKAVISLNNQSFVFQDINITDVKHLTTGVLNGLIRHEKFKKWFIDLKIKSDNLLVLDTQESEEALYYGTAFFKGDATIKGPTDNMVINVKGTTNPGTVFIIPLSDVSTVGESKLIHFINPNEEYEYEGDEKEMILDNFKGLTLNFDLKVTKDAVAQVVIDKQSGSLLRGSGDGELQLRIDTNGKFEMYGDLIIDNGEYKFKNIVSKDFIVEKGGTIIWNGSPFDAEIDITAVYHTMANPAVILDEVNSTRKIDVDLITRITGSLSAAQFDFDIVIPNSSSMVTSELEFKLKNPDDRLTQFISLLATGSFINLDNGSGNFNGSAALAGTLAEKSSEILTEMLKSNSEDFQVGVTYEAGIQNKVQDVNTNDQVGIQVSGRIGGKVIVKGKVGVPLGANTSSNSSVVGEVEVMLPLNEPETLMAKVYNRQNEVQFDVIESEGYTQGVGISYLFQFDNGREFLEKIGLKRTQAEKNMTKQQRDSVKAVHKLEKLKAKQERKAGKKNAKK